MTEAQIAAEWQGFVHGEGTGWHGQGRARARASRSSGRARASARSPRRRTARSSEGEPTLFEIWVCADGYWCDHTKNLVSGRARRLATSELEQQLVAVYADAVALCGRGASLAELDRRSARTRGAPAIPASRRTRSATASARARTSRPTRTRRAAARSRPGWCSRSSPASTGRRAAACGRGQLPRHRGRRRRS